MKYMKWLRKVPILLTALILLVSPLMMAAPARADVLSDSDLYIPGYSFLMESVFTDGAYETVRLYVQNPSPDLLNGYDFNVLVFDYPQVNATNVPEPGYYVYCGHGAYVDGDKLEPGYPNRMFKAILRQEFRDGVLCIFLDLDYQNVSSSVFGFYFPCSYMYSYGTPVADNRSQPFALTYDRPGVFSGAGEFVRGFIGMLGASVEGFMGNSVLMLFIFVIPLSMGAIALVCGLIKKRKR